MGFRITFVIITAILCIWFAYRMRSVFTFSDTGVLQGGTFEQRWLIILFITLFFYNGMLALLSRLLSLPCRNMYMCIYVWYGTLIGANVCLFHMWMIWYSYRSRHVHASQHPIYLYMHISLYLIFTHVRLSIFADPLYPLRLLTSGWGIEIFATLFEVSSNVALILFWLVMIDKIRRVRFYSAHFECYSCFAFCTYFH